MLVSLTKLVNGFLKLPAPVQKMAAVLATAAGGFLILLGVFLGIRSGIGKFSTALKVARLALAGISAPLLIIIALLAVFTIAYKKNFLGFGDLVRDVVGKVIGFIERLTASFERLRSFGINPLQAALFAVAFALSSAFGGSEVPINAAKKVMEIFGELRDVIIGLVDVVTLIASGEWAQAWAKFQDIITGAATGIGSAIKSLLSNLGALLIAGFAAIPWGAIGSAILDGLKSAVDIARAGLSALWSGLLEGAGIAAGWIFNVGLPALGGAFLDIAGDLWTWIKNEAIPGVTNLLENAGIAAGWIIDVGLPKLGGAVLTAFTNMWDFVKSGALWLSDTIARVLGSFNITVPGPVIAAGSAILSLITSMWEWVKSGVSWLKDTITHTLSGFDITVPGIAVAAGSAVLTAFTSMWEWIKSKVSWLKDSIDCVLAFFNISVPSPVAAAAGAAVEKYRDLCDWVKDKISWLKDIGGTIAASVATFTINVVVPLLTGGLAAIASAFTDIAGWLKSKVRWLASGIVNLSIPDVFLKVDVPKIIGLAFNVIQELLQTAVTNLGVFAVNIAETALKLLRFAFPNLTLAKVNTAIQFVIGGLGEFLGSIGELALNLWDFDFPDLTQERVIAAMQAVITYSPRWR